MGCGSTLVFVVVSSPGFSTHNCVMVAHVAVLAVQAFGCAVTSEMARGTTSVAHDVSVAGTAG